MQTYRRSLQTEEEKRLGEETNDRKWRQGEKDKKGHALLHLSKGMDKILMHCFYNYVLCKIITRDTLLFKSLQSAKPFLK